MLKQPSAFVIVAMTASLALVGCGPERSNNSSPAAKASPTSKGIGEDNADSTRDGSSSEQNRRPHKADPAAPNIGDSVLTVEVEGLRLFDPATTAATPIPFGRPQTEVLQALERLRGTAGKGVNRDCGFGPVEYASWPDGLSLIFQRNRFVGWGLDGRAVGALSTASGVGPGSPRKQLDAAYANVRVSRSSVGDEFTAGGFSGLIDGTKASSKITDMWAGVSCVAR